MDAGVVDGAQPRPEQAVQLLQVLDRVPGRVRVVAGDLGQELLLDSLEYPLDLAAAHRAAGGAVGQADAQHRARPGQGRIGKTRAVVRIQGAGDAVRGDRSAQHAGEPDRVRAADNRAPVRNRDRSSMMPARNDGRPATFGPFIRSAVQISFTAAASNRPNASGGAPPGGGQLAGLQPPLDRPHRRHAPALGGQDPADLRAGAGRVLHLQARRQLLGPGPQPGRALPRRGNQRLEPALAAGHDPPVQRAARHRHRLAVRVLVLAGRQVPHDRAALPRRQGRIHRRLDQRPPPQRDGVPPLPGRGRLPVCCCHLEPPGMPGS